MVLKSTRTIAKFSILMDPPRAAIIQCLRNQRPNQLDCLGVSATTTGVKFEGKGGSTQEGHLAQHKSSTAWHQATWPTRTADFSPLLSGKKISLVFGTILTWEATTFPKQSLFRLTTTLKLIDPDTISARKAIAKLTHHDARNTLARTQHG
jgi:hypothetical protein